MLRGGGAFGGAGVLQLARPADARHCAPGKGASCDTRPGGEASFSRRALLLLGGRGLVLGPPLGPLAPPRCPPDRPRGRSRRDPPAVHASWIRRRSCRPGTSSPHSSSP